MLGISRPSSATTHRNDQAIMRTTKIWCDRGTRPNRRLLAQPSAVVRRSPANRPAIPKIEMSMVIGDTRGARRRTAR